MSFERRFRHFSGCSASPTTLSQNPSFLRAAATVGCASLARRWNISDTKLNSTLRLWRTNHEGSMQLHFLVRPAFLIAALAVLTAAPAEADEKRNSERAIDDGRGKHPIGCYAPLMKDRDALRNLDARIKKAAAANDQAGVCAGKMASVRVWDHEAAILDRTNGCGWTDLGSGSAWRNRIAGSKSSFEMECGAGLQPATPAKP